MKTQADQREPRSPMSQQDTQTKTYDTMLLRRLHTAFRIYMDQMAYGCKDPIEAQLFALRHMDSPTIPGAPPPTSTVEPKGEEPETRSIVERLRENCNGHPHAKIAWPHYIMHEAADTIESLLAQIKASKEPAKSLPEKEMDKAGRGFCNKCGRSGVGEVAYGGVLHVGCGYVAVRTDQAAPPTPEKERGLKWGCRINHNDGPSWSIFHITPNGGRVDLHPDGSWVCLAKDYARWIDAKFPSASAAQSALNACTSAPPDYVQPQDPKP